MERSVLLLYMSPFGKNPNIHTQTNEAAVLELKKHKEGPDCILALCSELVRTSPTVHPSTLRCSALSSTTTCLPGTKNSRCRWVATVITASVKP